MTEADSTSTTGGLGAPNLSPIAKHRLAVIRDQIGALDNIRAGFIVVMKEVEMALPAEHSLLAAALRAMEQAMEAPLQNMLDELNGLAS